MIIEEDLKKWINIEISQLRYYGMREDRDNLTESSDIYRDVKSIGYTKRPLPLYRRCSWATISSDIPITKDSKLEDLKQVYTWDRINNFTPLEIYWILYPEKRKEIIYLLTKNQYE